MTTFALIHGAWHGGWYWKKVVPLLRKSGHEVLTPTLTGLGERSHLASPAVDLETHITDILKVLEYEEPDDVMLVGHSYGGMVISGVADRAPQRIRHLVYLDAFVPRHGTSLMDDLPAERVAEMERDVRDRGDDWQLPPGTPDDYGVTDAADIDWCAPKLVPQPVETFRQPLSLGQEMPCPASYILSSQGTNAFSRTANRVRDKPGWRRHELPAGHMVMVTMPRELAALLLGVAEEAEATNRDA